MEIEIKEYFDTVGQAADTATKMRGTLSRRFKPFGCLFTKKKNTLSSKQGKEMTKKLGKADRRKSGSTCDGPLTNYDSCDDPSQDHRTEPTTSVESMLGLSFSSRSKNRSFRRGISMVPALRNMSSIRIKADEEEDDDDKNNVAGAMTMAHYELALLHQISSCPIGSADAPLTGKESSDEGVELFLGGHDSDLPLQSETHDEISARNQVAPSPNTTSTAPKANSPPSTNTADSGSDQFQLPKISVTTNPFLSEYSRQDLAQMRTIFEAETLLSQDEVDPSDGRPLTEIMFLNNEDQFDDMDDLTLPPPGYAQPKPRSPSRPLYSRPVDSPPLLTGGIPGHGRAASRRPSPAVHQVLPLHAPGDKLGKGGEEMFASFVEERHGSFHKPSSMTKTSDAPLPKNDLSADGADNSLASFKKISLTMNAKPDILNRDSCSPAKSLVASQDSEEDLELIKINSFTLHDQPVKVSGESPNHSVSQRSSAGQARHTGQAKGKVEISGRRSRAGRLSSMLTSRESMVRGFSANSERKEDDILVTDGIFEASDGVTSPHEYVKQFFGRMYRKTEMISFASFPAQLTSLLTPSNEKAPPQTPEHVALPGIVVTPQSPPSVIWSGTTPSHALRPRKLSDDIYSASRDESHPHSDDSLTRDSLMEMLHIQAATSDDADNSLYLTRSDLLSSGSDLLVGRSASEDSSLSAADSTMNRAIPILKTFVSCGGINAYPSSSGEEESFATTEDDNLLSELKTDLFNTVDELKREGSFVVSKFIRQISNKN